MNASAPIDSDALPQAAETISVLLVDNDAATRLVLEQCLARTWGRVVVSKTAADAWRYFLSDQSCQIIIVDGSLCLPDGQPLVHALRVALRAAYTYIIATIRNPARSDIRAAMASGADDVLAKPFFYETLDQRMQVAKRMIALEARLLERQAELQAANARIEAINERNREELEAAADVQRALLPGDLGHISGIEVGWRYTPSAELGGDLIGCGMIDENRLGFYILDVSGHGVSAALLAVQVQRFLSPSIGGAGVVSEADGQASLPSQVVTRLNDRFPMSGKNQYFTIIYGYLDRRTGEVCWCSAGHPWPVLVTPAAARQVTVSGSPAVGWLPSGRARFCDNRLTLNPGEALLLFSDGVVEAFNRHRQQFTTDRLVDLVSDTAQTVSATLDGVELELANWIQGMPDQDDISMLMLRLTKRIDSEE